MLSECAGECLKTITRNPPGFPVAKHLKRPGHNIEVQCVKQCRGTDSARCLDEMFVIFHLDTLRVLRQSYLSVKWHLLLSISSITYQFKT